MVDLEFDSDVTEHLSGTGMLCPVCHHPAIIKPRRPSAFRSILGARPRPAECQVREDDVSGLSALPCGCRDHSHGS